MRRTMGIAVAAAAASGVLAGAPAAAASPAAAPQVRAVSAATMSSSLPAAAAGTSCGRWKKSYSRQLAVRACWRKVGKKTQPQGAWRNLTSKRLTVSWVIRYKTTPYGPWRVCKWGKGPLKPRQHWVTWCGWYKRIDDVRVTGTVVR